MAGITLQQAEAQLALWLDASQKVAARQSWSYQGRTFTAANAAEIRSMVDYWDTFVRRLDPSSSSTRRGPRVRGVVPL
jgi:hypothetical protein